MRHHVVQTTAGYDHVVQTTAGYDRVIASSWHVADAQAIVDALRANPRRVNHGLIQGWLVVDTEDLHTLKLTLLTAEQVKQLQTLEL